MNNQPSGTELITAERQRQMQVEGWSPEHDDEHTQGEIGRAGIAYAFAACLPHALHAYDWWPWAREWFKPNPLDRKRSLVKAGALIAAEIDRLNRLEP